MYYLHFKQYRIESIIDYNFSNKGFLSKALITRSRWEDEPNKAFIKSFNLCFEPYNTLGDGIVNVIVMEEGIKHNYKNKGDLTD